MKCSGEKGFEKSSSSQHKLSVRWMFVSKKKKKHAERLTTPSKPPPYPPCTHWPSFENAHAHTYFPRQRVIRQTLLADWNKERINSRWYHWEKMEHNVENAPRLAATGRHNQEREHILGMRCNREAKRMPHNVHSTWHRTVIGFIFPQIIMCYIKVCKISM